MDERQLELFLAVCEERGLARAAERCFISRQGLSKSIKTLEEELGVQLFIRRNKGVKLTKFGRALREAAPGYLADHRNIIAMIQRLKYEERSFLSIGLAHGSASQLPKNFLRNFLDDNSEVYLNVMTFDDSEIAEAMLKHKLEFGFMEGPVDDGQFNSLWSKKSELLLAMSEKSKLASLESVKIADVKQEPFIMLNKNRMLTHLCEREGIIPHVYLDASEIEIAGELAAANRGVFFTFAGQCGVPGLVFRKIDDLACSFEYHFVTNKKNRHSEAARRFVDYALAALDG
jgi:DNA-binding transcriptional LysR family regulator